MKTKNCGSTKSEVKKKCRIFLWKLHEQAYRTVSKIKCDEYIKIHYLRADFFLLIYSIFL